MPSYFSSCKLRLVLRLEEFASDAIRKRLPANQTIDLAGVSPTRGTLRAVPDPEAPDGVKRFAIVAGDGAPTATFSGVSQGGLAGRTRRTPASSDGRTIEVEGIIPEQITWKLTGPRSADELEAVVRYADFPFDPRVVRACDVDLFLGTIAPEDFAEGVAGGSRATGDGQSQSLLVVPDTFVDALGRTRSNLRFQGWLDEYEMQWGDDGTLDVHLKARDATHLFTLIDAPSGLTIDPKKPIDKAVADYLANFPVFEGTLVEYRGLGDAPVFEKVMAKTAFQPHLGPPVAKGGGAGDGDKLHVWEYVVDVCGAIGHVARVEGATVIIQQVRQLLGTTPPRTDDPYVPRVVDGISCPNRTLVYGRNVSSVSVKRNYTKKAPTNIEVVSYWPERKTRLVARYPPPDSKGVKGKDAKRQAIIKTGDGSHDNKWHVISVPGIHDQETLEEVARAAYELIGRNEVTVDLKTFDLAAFGGAPEDPDMLDLKCGDTIQLEVDYAGQNGDGGGNAVTELEARQIIVDRNVELMARLGYPDDIARAYAEAFTDQGFQRDFRLREMTVKWDVEEGPEVTIEAANYIVARVGVQGGAGADDQSKSRDDLRGQAERRTRLVGA